MIFWWERWLQVSFQLFHYGPCKFKTLVWWDEQDCLQSKAQTKTKIEPIAEAKEDTIKGRVTTSGGATVTDLIDCHIDELPPGRIQVQDFHFLWPHTHSFIQKQVRNQFKLLNWICKLDLNCTMHNAQCTALHSANPHEYAKLTMFFLKYVLYVQWWTHPYRHSLATLTCW